MIKIIFLSIIFFPSLFAQLNDSTLIKKINPEIEFLLSKFKEDSVSYKEEYKNYSLNNISTDHEGKDKYSFGL